MGDNKNSSIVSADKTEEQRETLRPSEDEIAAIVAGAALEIQGIHALGADMSASAITKNLLNAGNRARGVHLVTDGDGLTVDIYVIVEYGTNIPETAWNVQRRVSESLRSAQNIKTKEINIHVQGVHVPK